MRLIYGVGVNDIDYVAQKFTTIDKKDVLVWVCPFYSRWKSMLARCYSKKEQQAKPAYKGCSVCKEWLTFSNFKAWMEKQEWEGKSLDKDLLVRGNKVYSPDTCIFIDQRVNTFLTESTATRGDYPIGVNFRQSSGKFAASCRDITTSKRKHIGYFSCPNEAHKAWLAFKLEQAKILAVEQTDPRVAKALIERYENYSLLCY